VFILYAIPAGLFAGLLLGGRLEGLGAIRFRWAWVFLVGLAVQLVLFSDFVTGRIGAAGMPLYVLSTLAVDAAVLANVRIPGIPLVLAGAASNLAAILANGGYMPTSAAALEALDGGMKGGYSNSSLVESPALPWLTDVFALPAWLPMHNVFSIGDVLIGLGVMVVIASAMRSAVATGDPRGGDDATAPAKPTPSDPATPNSAPA
jgi:hypothetical protein